MFVHRFTHYNFGNRFSHLPPKTPLPKELTSDDLLSIFTAEVEGTDPDSMGISIDYNSKTNIRVEERGTVCNIGTQLENLGIKFTVARGSNNGTEFKIIINTAWLVTAMKHYLDSSQEPFCVPFIEVSGESRPFQAEVPLSVGEKIEITARRGNKNLKYIVTIHNAGPNTKFLSSKLEESLNQNL